MCQRPPIEDEWLETMASTQALTTPSEPKGEIYDAWAKRTLEYSTSSRHFGRTIKSHEH